MSTARRTDNHDIASALVRAWRDLYPDPARRWRGDSGGRAQLRRAVTPEALMLVPVFHEILFSLRDRGIDLPLRSNQTTDLYRRLALALGALAERRSGETGNKTFAAALGGNPKSDERRLSALRFQALVEALNRGPDADTLQALRRAMAIIGDDRIDLDAFVMDLLAWGHPVRPPAIAWTFFYYGHASHHDAATPTPHELEESAT